MSPEFKFLLVAGARPNFMKIAPVIREIHQRTGRVNHVLVHTGQHYDEGMSDIFFRELGIPAPDHYLNVGSGSHAEQTAKIMTKFEPVLQQEMPNCVMVFGDVNSTLACSIVAKKMGYPVAHVEAGLRSGDMTMPEEINRIVTDSISDYFFVTEPSGIKHLIEEGKDSGKISHVGHVMVDNLLFEIERLKHEPQSALRSNEMKAKTPRYGVITLHRPSNVDNEASLRKITSALCDISLDIPLYFPVHPRTKSMLEKYAVTLPPSIILTEPLGYREFLNLWKDAVLVLTDSGGLQEESTALGVPCLTLRTNTERPVTVEEGTNTLVGVETADIIAAAKRITSGKNDTTEHRRPHLWDGRASERILDVLTDSL